MNSERDNGNLVVDDIYHKSFADLDQLRTALPPDTVTALAKEVIARLAGKAKNSKADPGTIVGLSKALVSADPEAAAALIEKHFARGLTIDAIYLEYLAPASEQLGEWWTSDKVSFAEVTVGTGRIYAIMRSLSRRIRPAPQTKEKSALFAMVPGDDHVLGLRMAIDLARDEGWEIEAHLATEHDALVDEITASGHLLVGLSAGSSHSFPNLVRLIVALRVSVPNIKIVLSGGILDKSQDKVQLLDADAIARTFEDAMSALDRLWNDFHPDET